MDALQLFKIMLNMTAHISDINISYQKEKKKERHKYKNDNVSKFNT